MTDPAIKIRILDAEDYDAVVAVWQAAGLKVRLTGRESPSAFTKQMASGLQTILGAEIDGMLAGVALATHDGRKGWINRLAVRPEFQRRGLGQALLQAAEKMFHEMGLEIVAALVEHYNTASRALFEAEGFTVEATYYMTKRDRPDA